MLSKDDKKEDIGKSMKQDKDPVKKYDGKAKKKWSKGKGKDTLNNLLLYDKLSKEVPNYKLITSGIVSEILKFWGSLAKATLQELSRFGQSCLHVSSTSDLHQKYK